MALLVDHSTKKHGDVSKNEGFFSRICAVHGGAGWGNFKGIILSKTLGGFGPMHLNA